MGSLRLSALTSAIAVSLIASGCPSALAPLGVTVTAEPADGRAPLQVTFTALLVGDEGDSGLTYDWDFGDGTANASDESPVHTFDVGGGYEVSVTVTRNEDDFVAVGTISIDVDPNSEPTVVAGASPDMGLEPLTVTFTAFVTDGDGPIDYSWDFGDGNTSNVPNPVHTYTAGGSYDATVTVVDEDGDTASDTVSVAVGTDDIPAPTATATPDTGIAPLTVDFTCTSVGGNAPLSFQWDFGDGSSLGLATATHTYTTSGVFNATCTVTDDDGSVGVDSVLITVGLNNIPQAIASATYMGNAAPLTVDFTGIGIGGDAPLAYSWDFGDGNTSTMQNPQHIYTTSGTYAAVLTVTDTDGDFDVDTVTINVGTGTIPTATANGSPTTGDAPLMVTFTGNATGGDGTLTYAWDFGDGNASTLQNPTNTYAADGNYTAILTVTDQDGDFDVDTVDIIVGIDTMPVASASASPTNGANPLVVNFTGTGIGGDGTLTYDWDFGDGNTSTLQSPTHTYTADGTFVAILTVTDADGDFDVDTVVIDVFTDLAPTASAAGAPTMGMVPLPVSFTGIGTGGDAPLSYLWNFGDAVTSPLQNPSHTYMASGVFDATLTVTDVDGDFDMDTVQITVNPMPGNGPPAGTITTSTTCAVPNRTLVQLGSTYTDPEMDPITYSWVFVSVPAGSTASFNNPTVSNPTFMADMDGTYELRAFVSDGTNMVASNLISITAGSPATIIPLAGEPQSTPVTLGFGTPFDVNVINVCGATVATWGLTWSGTNASPDMGATTTNGLGDSSNTATAGIVAGPASVTVTADGTAASFTWTLLTVTPGPVDRVLVTPPGDTAVNGPMPFVVEVFDAFGNAQTTDPVDVELCVFTGGPTVTFEAPIGSGMEIVGCNLYTTAGGTATANVFGEQVETVGLTVNALSHPGAFSGSGGTLFFDDLEAGDDGMWNVFPIGMVEDWELGAPTNVGPPAAFSGTNAWGTDLDANYVPGMGGFFTDMAVLERGFDASAFTSPFGPPTVMLTQWEYFDTFADPSGCPQGGTFQLGLCGPGQCVVQAVGRMFDSFSCELPDPGYTGASGGWVPVAYDLTPFVGPGFFNVSWSLHRGVDGTTGAGWYLDDIQVEAFAPNFVAGNFIPGPPAQLLVTGITHGVAGCPTGEARVEVTVIDPWGNPTGTTELTAWTPDPAMIVDPDNSIIVTGPDVGLGFTPIPPDGAELMTDMGTASVFIAEGDPMGSLGVEVSIVDLGPGALMGGTAFVDFPPPTPIEAGMCDDGVDNNCDGLVDCNDPTCAMDLVCQTCLTDFDDGTLQNWTVSATCDPPITWSVDPVNPVSPPFSLYYGDPTARNFNCGGSANSGTVTSPFIQLPPMGSVLTFDYFVDGECGPGPCSWDNLHLTVIPMVGPPAQIWTGIDTGGAFVNELVDLSPWDGQIIQLEFLFDTLDGIQNSNEGAYLDNIDVNGPCL